MGALRHSTESMFCIIEHLLELESKFETAWARESGNLGVLFAEKNKTKNLVISTYNLRSFGRNC
jgi:hypothetical protein